MKRLVGIEALAIAAPRRYVDIEELKTRPPIQRLGTVQDVVAAIRFLASEEAGFITGQTLGVDGGWTYAA